MDPIRLAGRLWRQARRSDPNADVISLATVDGRGNPSVRAILLKAVDARGFHFVTQARGPKAKHLRANAHVELCVNWGSLALQLRLHGRVVSMPAAAIDALWRIRQRDAQILYHLRLPQSAVIPSHAYLLKAMAAGRRRWRGVAQIPRSPWYVGYIIVPEWIEVFHHSASRLNKRDRYVRRGKIWQHRVLAP